MILLGFLANKNDIYYASSGWSVTSATASKTYSLVYILDGESKEFGL